MKHCRYFSGLLQTGSMVVAAMLTMGTPDARALTLLPPAAGSINSPEAAGYIERGLWMRSDANSRGAADQLAEAMRLYPTAAEAERAAAARALNAMTIPGADAMGMLEKFMEKYPASAWRLTALVAVADVWFDRGEYAMALEAYNKLSLDALDETTRNEVIYHTAFCRLKLTDYDSAAAGFAALESAPEFANDARFYQGYIAYARGDYNHAARLFEAVAPNGMPTAMAAYYLAQINYARADYRAAAQNARALLESRAADNADPAFTAEMNRIEGESLYRLGDHKAALPYLETYVSSTEHPLNSAMYLLGLDDFENGRYEQAIQRLTPVTSEDTAMGQSAFLYLGQSYLKLDNYNAASLALDKAARMDRDRDVQEAAFYNRAVAGMQGGKVPFGSSVNLLEEFLRRYPESANAPEVADYVVSGYMTDNNYPAALAAINRIAKPTHKVLEAKQKVLYTLGSRELQAGRPRQATTYLREAAGMTGYNASTAAEALLWLGEAQFKNGDYADAVESYNRYLRQDLGSAANRALAYYDLGYARLALKDYADAKADFAKFIERTDRNADKTLLADAYNRMADAQYYMSDFQGAAATYSKALSTNPQAGDYPMFQQGIMKGLQRDHAGKLETLGNMIEKFPRSALIPSAMLEMGESYGETGDNARAIETYTALAGRYPATAQGRQGELMLAITYLNEQNRPQAIAHYKKVITSYPSSEEARVAADDLKQLYAEQGAVSEYVAFINSVPDAPKPESAEFAALNLVSAEKALENNRLTDALAAATEVVEKYPDSPQAVDALIVKADAEARMGRTADAMATYQALEKRASNPSDVSTALMGILRLSRDLGDNDTAIATADRLLESSTLGEAGKREVSLLKAMALNDSGSHSKAIALWSTLADDIDDINGTKAQYYIAQTYSETGDDAKATEAVNHLIDANPPHDYWLARGFILLSDLLRKKGDTFEADEYLRSLRENYPGNEADIFRMVDERLKK